MADNWSPFLGAMSYLESNQNPNARNRSSTATGAFQFLNGTAKEAMGMGIPNPQTGSYQDQADATQQYIRRVKPKAAAAIDSGDYNTAISELRGIWPSLPGGSQPQSADRYQQFSNILGGGGSPELTGGARGDTMAGPNGQMLPPDVLAMINQQRAPNDWGGAIQGAGAALAGITSPAQGAALQSGANATLQRQLAQQQLGKPQYQALPDGTVIAMYPNGQVASLGHPGAQEMTTLTAPSGAQYQQPKYQMSGQPGATSANPNVPADLAGQPLIDWLSNNPLYGPAYAAETKAMGDYETLPGSRLTDRGRIQIGLAHRYNPDWNETRAPEIVQQTKDYGPGGKIGSKFVAASNSMMHLDQYAQLMDRINNGEVVPMNALENIVGHNLGQTGPVTAKVIGDVASAEIAKNLRGVGNMSKEEIERWQNSLSTSLNSKQVYSVANSINHAIGVQEQNQKDAWQYTPFPEGKINLISPQAKAAAARIEQRNAELNPSTPAGQSKGTKYPGVRSISPM